MSAEVVILGPQRHAPNLQPTLAARGIDSSRVRLAAITAGWEEREEEDQELGEHLGAPVVNLGIYRRVENVFQSDPELLEAANRHHQILRRLREIYRMRMRHAMTAARRLLAAAPDESIGHYLDDERESAISVVRTIDEQHVQRVNEVYAEFEDRWHATQRDSVAREREELRRRLDDCGAVLIAGGHVGVLVYRMRLLGVADLLRDAGDKPIFAWSAGAMVLCERIVLFHDSPPQGPGDAEVLEAGLGLACGIVPLPHAHHRLRLEDRTRVELFARRFEPLMCATLEDGSVIEPDPDGDARWRRGGSSLLLETSGHVQEVPA